VAEGYRHDPVRTPFGRCDADHAVGRGTHAVDPDILGCIGVNKGLAMVPHA